MFSLYFDFLIFLVISRLIFESGIWVLIVQFLVIAYLLLFLERAILGVFYVLHAIFESLVMSHFGFDARSLTLIVSVLAHCLY